MKLNKAQRDELYAWQTENPEDFTVSRDAEMKKSKKDSRSQKKRKANQSTSQKTIAKLVASEVAKAVGTQSTDDKEKKESKDIGKYLASMVDSAVAKAQQPHPPAAAAASVNIKQEPPSLRSILRAAKNSGSRD